MKNRLLEFINHHDYRAVELLLAYGANVYERNEKGRTVFHKLARSCNYEYAVETATKLFEKRGIITSFLDVEDYRRCTALQLACEKCNWSMAE